MPTAARSAHSDLTVTPVSPALGAQVVGLDVSRPLDPSTLAILRDAFQDHHMLCFRDQRLDDDQQVAFSTQFGPLELFPEKDKTKGKIEVYNVANVSPEGETSGARRPAGDLSAQITGAGIPTVSYRYIPSLASIMYGVEVLPDDSEGGETGFSNMLAAYAALPDNRKNPARNPCTRCIPTPTSGVWSRPCRQ